MYCRQTEQNSISFLMYTKCYGCVDHTEVLKYMTLNPKKQIHEYIYIYIHTHTHTFMRRLTTEIRSEKCVVRRFRRCANVITQT
jgi:hypothetical protein